MSNPFGMIVYFNDPVRLSVQLVVVDPFKLLRPLIIRLGRAGVVQWRDGLEALVDAASFRVPKLKGRDITLSARQFPVKINFIKLPCRGV